MAKRSKRKNKQQADLNGVTHAVDAEVKRPSHEQFADALGFKTSSVTLNEVRSPANQTSQAPRRKRVAGRSISFSVKLRADTLEYIYAIANGRGIPLAQVIEELVEVHAHQQVANAKSTGTGLGFRSGEPKTAEQQHTVSGLRQATFTDTIHVRLRSEDRGRFEDFADRHRLSKEAAMTRLLDSARFRRTEEKRQTVAKR